MYIITNRLSNKLILKNFFKLKGKKMKDQILYSVPFFYFRSKHFLVHNLQF